MAREQPWKNFTYDADDPTETSQYLDALAICKEKLIGRDFKANYDPDSNDTMPGVFRLKLRPNPKTDEVIREIEALGPPSNLLSM